MKLQTTFDFSYIVDDIYKFWKTFGNGFYHKHCSLAEFKSLLSQQGNLVVLKGKKVRQPDGRFKYYIPFPEEV